MLVVGIGDSRRVGVEVLPTATRPDVDRLPAAGPSALGRGSRRRADGLTRNNGRFTARAPSPRVAIILGCATFARPYRARDQRQGGTIHRDDVAGWAYRKPVPHFKPTGICLRPATATVGIHRL